MLLLLLGPGCASIVTPGRFRPVEVQTHPPNAAVYVNEKFEGRTPVTLRVDRKAEHRVKLVSPGRETFYDTIEPGFNGWYLGNLVFGGVIGLVVDGVNGSILAPKPNRYDLYLLPPGGDYEERDQRRAAERRWKEAEKRWKREQKKWPKSKREEVFRGPPAAGAAGALRAPSPAETPPGVEETPAGPITPQRPLGEIDFYGI